MAGFSDRDAIWLAAIPAFGNFLFTLVGLLLVDRIGRRKLIIGSKAGVILSLALLGAGFYVMDIESPRATPMTQGHCDFSSCGACVGNSKCGFCVDHVNGSYVDGTCNEGKLVNRSMLSEYRDPNVTCLLYFEKNATADSDMYDVTAPGRQWHFNSCPDNKLASLTIVTLFLYIAFFAPGMGPLPWTVNSEIYPTWARSTAIAIATTVNWLCNLIISMTFLTLTDSIGQPATFWMYAGLGVLGLVFMVLLVPETKGRKLEEVEQLFQRPWFTNWCS
jgi:SP family myo-inositol transporter-like MFS transporter 13